MSRVLVVDDDPSIRSVLTDALQDEGYGVDAAADGLEALAFVRASPPDVILLDLMMPIMDGQGFLNACRHARLCQEVPVVVLSAAHNLGTQAEELHRLGARASLAKPFDLDAILALVERYAPPNGA